MFLALPTLTH